MERRTLVPRANWQAEVERLGLTWHTVDGRCYWNEGACYVFARDQIDEIEGATAELYRLFVEAADAIVEDPEGLLAFGIPPHCHQPIREAWRGEPPALNYGRFDLGYDGKGPPKLFEFNCDTPTSLVEAAVVQWNWKRAVFPSLDQFNSIHELLVAKWRDIAPFLEGYDLFFTSVADEIGEDTGTIDYLRDTASHAGVRTDRIGIDEIGWDRAGRRFVGLDNRRIHCFFKLYPWEWLVNEKFGPQLIESLPTTLWMEPIWKMMWSNKAILPVLWSMFPDHPNLLPASFFPLAGDHVQKPRLAREGANVEVIRGGRAVASSGGRYGGEGFIHQALFDLPDFGGHRPVIGSWVVDGEPAGMGIREDGLITGNAARFVPHVMEG